MLLRTFLILALGMVFSAAYSAAATQHQATVSADSISGEWDVSFVVEGTTTPATFDLKLDGEKVTGNVHSAHTGPGTISGTWANDKLSITMDFKAHESIALTGWLKDGKLSGDFRTEGFVSRWQAQRKATPIPPSVAAPAVKGSAESADPISGVWDASLQAQGTQAPVTFKFKLEGEKVTGVSESEHLGSGTLHNGSWKANKLSFTIDGNFGVIALTGELREGKLAGEWSLTGKEMKGAWEAKKK